MTGPGRIIRLYKSAHKTVFGTPKSRFTRFVVTHPTPTEPDFVGYVAGAGDVPTGPPIFTTRVLADSAILCEQWMTSRRS